MNLAILALFIGIPYETNASVPIELFLQKNRNSNNPLEQNRNPIRWKHDSKRKVSQCAKLHFNSDVPQQKTYLFFGTDLAHVIDVTESLIIENENIDQNVQLEWEIFFYQWTVWA